MCAISLHCGPKNSSTTPCERVLTESLEALRFQKPHAARLQRDVTMRLLAALLGVAAGDHYHTLGLRRRASQKQIKTAYRDLAKTHHPDKGGDVEQFAAVASAYEVLGDDVKRRRYDNERLGSEHGFGGGHGFRDPHGFGGFGQRPQRFVYVRRNGRMYRVPLDDYDAFERSHEGGDSAVSLQMVALALLAAFFYFSSAVAADVNGTGVPRPRAPGYEADVDEDDDAPPPLLDAGSSIRALKAECVRRCLSTEGCAEKGDLLRLLGIPV